METLANELLRLMESLPRRAPQRWLGELSKGEYFLLNYLKINGGTAWPSAMREALQTSTARIAAALNNMENKGWVKRESDDSDHRRKLVHLTPAGSEYIEEHRELVLKNITKLLNELGTDDATEFLRITQRMEEISRNFNFDL